MADRSAIEWTDATWNPVRARNRVTGKVGWHCEHASEGCRNCYSETFNERRLGTGLPFKPGHRADVELFLDEKMLLAPLRWRRPRRIFVGSMTDLFADFVPDVWLDGIFAVMAASSRHPLDSHVFQLLTKRPTRARTYLSDPNLPKRLARAWCTVGRDTNKGWTTLAWIADGSESLPAVWPLPNVWLGTSCEDQATADARVPELLATSAAVRFVSAEPLLGPIDFARWLQLGGLDSDLGLSNPGLDWIIVGGESGPHARPMHPVWVEAIRDQCAAADVAFFFKQWGEWSTNNFTGQSFAPDGSSPGPDQWDDPSTAWIKRIGKKAAGRLLNGVTHDAMPEATTWGRPAA